MKCKAYNGEVRSSEKDFETLQLGAFATPGLLLAQGPVDLTNCGIRVHTPVRRAIDLCGRRLSPEADPPLAEVVSSSSRTGASLAAQLQERTANDELSAMDLWFLTVTG
jgi:ABC-type transporter Mla maintaining outer membrane lipid asymmetry permease subunit MlaE